MSETRFPFQPGEKIPQDEMPEYREGSSMTRQPWGEHPVVPYSKEEEEAWMRTADMETSETLEDEERSNG